MPKRRSVAEMLASMPTPEAQAVYALERIAAIEDQIARVLKQAGPGARPLIFRLHGDRRMRLQKK